MIPPLVIDGQFKYKEEVLYGLDKVGQALLSLATGANNGKIATVVSDD